MRFKAFTLHVSFIAILAIPLVGSRSHTLQITDEYVRIHRSPQLTQLMRAANQHFRAGEFARSEAISNRGLALARATGDQSSVALFLSNLGSYYVIVNRHADALRAFGDSNRVALAIGYRALLLRNFVNLATLYRRMGDNAASIEVMRRLEGFVPRQPPSWMLGQMANVDADAGFQQAARLYHLAVDTADREGNSVSQALYWNQLGYGHLLRGELALAEAALTEAFRLRQLFNRQDLATSYLYLGMLRIEQNDSASAINLFNRAIAMSQKMRVRVPPASLYYQRGRAQARLGNVNAAFADYETAIEFARKWRLDIPPADEFRISAESTLQKTYTAYIEAGMELSLRHNDRQLAARMWEALEENRSSSLRDRAKSTQNLPVVYWETMSALRALLPGEVAGEINATRQAAALRLKLSEIEADSGQTSNYSLQIKERTVSDNPLIRLQQTLTSGEALLSFHIGEHDSYAWAITRVGVEVRKISDPRALGLLAEQFRRSIERGEAPGQPGRQLFQLLFGSFSDEIHDRREWLLSVNEPLFNIPYSALLESGKDGKPEYLVERRSIRLLPGALLTAPQESLQSNRFAGIADPIYNSADPRGPRSAERSVQQFPRLPGSGREIKLAARSWTRDPDPTLLTGGLVTRKALHTVLATSPGIAHFALHVVQNPMAADQVLLALGLQNSKPEYLSPSEITAERVAASLIVLSGCGSGTGKALPGAGLLGLTRAWLAAGARSVTATYWPIPDDAEDFFQEYYTNLNRAGDVGARASAEALRSAQIKMLRGGGPHATPKYWSAFFAVGKG